MGSRTRTLEHDRGGRELSKQPHRFAGLFLAPFAGLLGSWLIHYWTRGVHLHWGPIDWDVSASPAAGTIAVFLVALATAGLSVLGYRFAAHRESAKQWALAGSVFVVGAVFAINVGTGPHYWWSGILVIAGWAVAGTWSIARLDVARNDKREGDEEQEDGLLKKLGISRKTRFRSKIVDDEVTGEPLRAEISVEHAPGETVAVLQDGISNIESLASAPPGMSTAVVDPDHADRSTLTVNLTDPFKRNIPVGPPTAPGGSIADYATVADYANGKPAFVTIAAGRRMPSSTSFALIGTTRSGKTGTETQLFTEWGSRTDWAFLYLNQAKGKQDIRPILPIVEAGVIAEDGERGTGTYLLAMKKVREVMGYRQDLLGDFGVSAWSPRCADRNPDKRPSRLGAGGKRIVMPAVPFFLAHFAEADSILSSGRSGDEAVFLASKGLSLGVATGWSLQKPDWKSMPTNLRSQIGLWFVHGLAEDGDEEFVIDEAIRKAGAHPGKWGQRKPGQHYMIGPGIDESLFPTALKTRFLVGSDRNPDGSPIDFDTLNDRYMAEMLRRNMRNAATMMRLDQGSVDAMGGWWEEQVAKTADLRDHMLTPQGAPASSPRKSATTEAYSPRKVWDEEPPQDAPDDEEDDPQETEELMREFDEDVAEAEKEESASLYGDDEDAAEIRKVRLTRTASSAGMDVDPLADGTDDKPPAKTRDEAVAEVRRTLKAMAADPKYADPKEPGTAVVTPGMVTDEFRLRTRPWVSNEMIRMMTTGGELDDGVLMERIGDPKHGRYRLRPTGPAGHVK